MKRVKLMAGVLALVSLLVLNGCDVLNNISNLKNQGSSEPTLAEKAVDELVAKLDTNSSKSIFSSRSFSSSSISEIKTAALKQIALDGLTDAKTLDTILASMLKGVKNAISATVEISDPSVAATIMTLATESAVGSMLIEERKGNLSSGITAEQAVGSLTETAIQAIIAVVPDASLVNQAINATITAMIEELNSSTSSAITTETTQATINAIVSGAVSATFDNPSVYVNVSDTISAVTTTALEAVVSSTVISTEQQTAIVSSIISSTVEIIIENNSNNAQNAQTIIMDTVAAVVVSQGTNAPTTSEISDAVSQGITNGSIGTPTIVIEQTAITAVVEEAAPVITIASADITTVVEENKLVTLTAVATTSNPSDTVNYEWIQLSGPRGFTGAINTTGLHSFAPPLAGTYVFKVIVRNVNGFKQTESEPVSITASFVPEASKLAIYEGINYLKLRKWDNALTSFTKALALDPTSETALFWKAFLELNSITVDPSIVSLMKNRIGLVDYPSTMNTLYSNTWFSGTYYGAKTEFIKITTLDPIRYYFARGTFTANNESNTLLNMTRFDTTTQTYEYYQGRGTFVTDPNGIYYINAYRNGMYSSYTDDNGNITLQFSANDILYEQNCSWIDLAKPIHLPKLNIPTWIQPMLAVSEKNFGGDNTHINISNYAMLLIGNIIERNPTGLNEALDLVLNGAYGARFESAANAIMSLPDTAAITVPNDLIYTFGGSSTINMPNTASITITKPMLQMALSQMYASKAFVELLASYNLSYPINNAMFDYSKITKSQDVISKIPNPLKTSFLADRSQITRDKAKADLLLSLSTMNTALTTLEAYDLKSWMSSASGQTITQDQINTSEAQVKSYFALVKKGIDILQKSFEYGTSIYIEPSDFSNGNALKADYIWTYMSSPTTIKIAPYTLFETDIFNPQKLFVKTANGGFKAYGCDTTTTDGSAYPSNLVNFVELTDETTQSELTRDTIAVEILTSRIQQLLPNGTTMLPLLEGQTNYFIALYPVRTEWTKDANGYFSSKKLPATPFDQTNDWPFIKWLRGE